MSNQVKPFPDLRSIRKESGATLHQWSSELDLSPSQLSNIERRFFTRLSLNVALRVAERYRVPVESLVGRAA